MAIFTEEQRSTLREAGRPGMSSMSSLPTETGKGSDYDMVMDEMPQTFKRLMMALKRNDPKGSKYAMTSLVSELAAVARVVDGLELFRAPLTKLAKRYGAKQAVWPR